jgi:hypothetical protein
MSNNLKKSYILLTMLIRHHSLITLRSEGVGVVRAQRNHHRVCITKQRNMGWGGLENVINGCLSHFISFTERHVFNLKACLLFIKKFMLI